MATSLASTRIGRRLRRQQFSRRRRAAVLGCALVAGTTTTMVSAALFTDATTVPGAAVDTSNVVLELAPTARVFSFTLAPGESFVTPLTVSNNGPLALRYAVRGNSDAADANFIAPRLRFTAKTGVTTCTTPGFAASGTVIAGPVTAASTTGTNVLGSPTQGGQTGDRVLGPGASEVLCLQTTLPADQRGDIGGRSTTVTYTFAAEQTANNP